MKEEDKPDVTPYLEGKTVAEAIRVCRANNARLVVYDWWTNKLKAKPRECERGDFAVRVWVIKGEIKRVI